MTKNIINSFVFRALIPLPYGALIYLLLLLINNNLLILDESFISAELLFCIGLSYVTFEANRVSIILFFNPKKQALLIAFFTQILLALLITIGVVYLALMYYFMVFLGYETVSGFNTEIISFTAFFGVSSILYNLLAISYNLLTKKNKQLIANEEILKEQIQYELENYQAQVNPDLLFESLESAITLIHQDAVKAEDYIDHLALAYRYILGNQHNETAFVKEEIEATTNLLALYNVKYKGLIQLEIKTTQTLDTVIPSSIPLLVDEIIKSTIISEVQPLVIVLGKEDNYLTLSYKKNNRLRKNNHELLTFERLHKAYSYYTDAPLVKVFGYGKAYYKIPLLNVTEAAA